MSFHSSLKSVAWALLSTALAIAIWSAIILIARPPEYVLPAPWDVVARTWSDRSALIENGAFTLSEILTGLVAGTVLAVPMGIAVVAVPLIERLFYPIVVAFNAIPKVALAPVFVVWFGYGYMPRVLLTASVALFPVLISTISGLIAVDPDLLRLAAALRAKRSRIFIHVRLPQALPTIFAGIKVATSLAVIGSIIAEFIASDKGWGHMLVQASGNLDTTIMFAVLLVLALVASALFYTVAFLERFFISWHASQRAA
jgi:NitT/TauT family transport system permease protein